MPRGEAPRERGPSFPFLPGLGPWTHSQGTRPRPCLWAAHEAACAVAGLCGHFSLESAELQFLCWSSGKAPQDLSGAGPGRQHGTEAPPSLRPGRLSSPELTLNVTRAGHHYTKACHAPEEVQPCLCPP